MSEKHLHDNTVLLVDDEQDILDVLEAQVSTFIKHVRTCPDPLEALEIVRNNRIDVAVLDISMPKMDGFILLREIKKISPTTTCVIQTALGDKENIQTALRFGAYDFLEKPTNMTLIKLCIIRALEKNFHDSITHEMLGLLFSNGLIEQKVFETLPFSEKRKSFAASLQLLTSRLKANA